MTFINPKVGWASYSDTTYTTGSRLTVNAGVRTVLPNNSGDVIESYIDGNQSFYNGTVIQPNTIGDFYTIRISFKVQPSTINSYLSLDVDIGGSVGIFLEKTFIFPKGAVETSINTSFSSYSLGTFVTNGGTVSVTPSSNVDIWDIKYVIAKIMDGDQI